MKMETKNRNNHNNRVILGQVKGKIKRKVTQRDQRKRPVGTAGGGEPGLQWRRGWNGENNGSGIPTETPFIVAEISQGSVR